MYVCACMYVCVRVTHSLSSSLNRRLSVVELFLDQPLLTEGLICKLKECADLERLLQKAWLLFYTDKFCCNDGTCSKKNL